LTDWYGQWLVMTQSSGDERKGEDTGQVYKMDIRDWEGHTGVYDKGRNTKGEVKGEGRNESVELRKEVGRGGRRGAGEVVWLGGDERKGERGKGDGKVGGGKEKFL